MILERFSGWSRRRKILTLAAVGVAAAVVAVVLVWVLVWRGDAPPPPSVLERSEALTATTASPTTQVAEASADAPPADPTPAADPTPVADPESPPPPAEPAPGAAEPPAAPAEPAPAPPPPSAEPAPASPAVVEPGESTAVNLDGVWSVDTTLGSYEDYTSSWVGYRVGEELAGIGTTEAVGRTPAVSGTLEIDTSTVVAATVEVDLTTVVSDRPQRDGLVRRALDTEQFPSARFELVEPVVFDALPAIGESVTAPVAGTFEIHGVSRPVTITLEATWVEGIVIVGGSFEIRFEDFGVNPPRAPVVLSVEDTGTVELLLNFTR